MTAQTTRAAMEEAVKRVARGAVVTVKVHPNGVEGADGTGSPVIRVRVPMPSMDHHRFMVIDQIEGAVCSVHPCHSATAREREDASGWWLIVDVPLA